MTCWRYLRIVSCCILAACGPATTPQDAVTDPPTSSLPQRIVTLSPHLAELVFAVGAGDQLVGVSAYTSYPPAAAELPVVGDAFNIDQEQLLLLQPDLLLAWGSGTPAHVVDELRSRGFRVTAIETKRLADIAAAVVKIGVLTGHAENAQRVAESFEQGLNRLQENAKSATPVRVFYQVSARPLYTVSDEHYISELIALCGGENVFAGLGALAPSVGVEAVLERDPEILMASSDAGAAAFAEWERWPTMAANRYNNHFIMPADEIGRATPRLLVAAAEVCEALDEGRRNRDATDND